jgi:hypothetical protein
LSTWTIDTDKILANAQIRGNRPAPVLTALVNILEQNLPGYWQSLNVVPSARMAETTPKTFQLQRLRLPEPGDVYEWPACLVGGQIDQHSSGMGWEAILHVRIVIAWQGADTSPRQLEDAMDVATAAQGVLMHPNFQAAFVNPDTGQRLWYGLQPAGFAPTPTEWPYYTGWMALVDVSQSPDSGGSLWYEAQSQSGGY